jgi:CRISPR system Cascade subunit CasA
MNLLHKPWLPVRHRDGSRGWITPDRLSDPDIVAFDAARPDFNGALAQFAIGLLQTTMPMDSPIAWKQLFANPPDAATLSNWFAPVATAFEFDGDGARFMQDFSLKADEGTSNEIGALLIESPGDSTKEKNIDHFVKRDQVGAICPCCAATALLTLQINAPEGGRGYLTGLRGGGPLSTLIVNQIGRAHV